MNYINKKNGFGLAYFEPCDDDDNASFSPWFDDYTYYLDKLESTNLLLYGEPGAGKSRIIGDILHGSRNLGRYCLQISCHINGSSPKGSETTLELLDYLIKNESMSALLLDNLDYSLYTGGNNKRKKSNEKALQYYNFLSSKVLAPASDAGIKIFATSHTAEWRANHSRIENIEDLFNDLISCGSLDMQYFDGILSKENAKGIFLKRGVNQELALKITNELAEANQLYFRNVYHLNIETIALMGVSHALKIVNDTKMKKIVGGM